MLEIIRIFICVQPGNEPDRNSFAMISGVDIDILPVVVHDSKAFDVLRDIVFFHPSGYLSQLINIKSTEIKNSLIAYITHQLCQLEEFFLGKLFRDQTLFQQIIHQKLSKKQVIHRFYPAKTNFNGKSKKHVIIGIFIFHISGIFSVSICIT